MPTMIQILTMWHCLLSRRRLFSLWSGTKGLVSRTVWGYWSLRPCFVPINKVHLTWEWSKINNAISDLILILIRNNSFIISLFVSFLDLEYYIYFLFYIKKKPPHICIESSISLLLFPFLSPCFILRSMYLYY